MILRALFLLSIMLAFPAIAAEPLFFHKNWKGIREMQMVQELTDHGPILKDIPLEIAPFDLNGDGVSEWIIRQNQKPECEAESACRFTVAGLRGKKPALLGMFEAGKVGVSSEKAYGVHKLLVYNKKNDDYAYSVFVWDPQQGRFGAE